MKTVVIPKRIVSLLWTGLLSSSTLLMAQAGSLDSTFGTGGIVTTPNTTTRCGQVVNCSVAIQSDGAIVVAGGATAGNGAPEAALARYTPTGRLDSTFSSGGIAVQANAGPFFGLAIQIDGKIIAAAPQPVRSVAVFRYNTNGTLDTTFGTDGIASFRPGGLIFAPVGGSLALLGNGEILVAVNGHLVRLLSNGQLDSSFGNSGIAQTINSGALGLLSNGEVLMLGGNMGRYKLNGILDMTFGTAGQAPSFGQAAAILPLSDGHIILAGVATSGGPMGGNIPQGFVLTRYNSNGTIDTTFGTRGSVVTSFAGEGFSTVAALAVQLDGDIVTAGVAEARSPAFGQEPSDFALARYTPTGQLDTSFGNNGRVTTAFGANGGNSAAVSALAIQSDGKIVAVGYDNSLTFGAPNNGFTLARYLGQ